MPVICAGSDAIVMLVGEASKGSTTIKLMRVGPYQLSFPVSICQYITQSPMKEYSGRANEAGRFFS